MKNKDLNINLQSLPLLMKRLLRTLSLYRVFIFFLLVASVYGYIIVRINVYSNAPADQSETTAKTVPQPRIDKATTDKIQSLQDNSVNVQTLFVSARDNPFQE